ncbi:MAG: hypothetical protein WBV82_09520 [Myxococcaceae bacterium]
MGSTPSPEPVPAEPKTSRPALTFAYFGEFASHPGLLIGGELPLAESGGHRLFAGANVGTYWHQRHSVGAFAGAELGYRHTFNFGLRAELLAGAGYLRTFLAAPVYAPDANGTMTEVQDGGRSALMPSTAFGLGWHFDRARNGPLAAFARVQLFWQYPYNNAALIHPALQVGLNWHFGG